MVLKAHKLLKELTEATTVHSISRCELVVDDSLESSVFTDIEEDLGLCHN